MRLSSSSSSSSSPIRSKSSSKRPSLFPSCSPPSLLNTGNICYANATFQALWAAPALRNVVRHWAFNRASLDTDKKPYDDLIEMMRTCDMSNTVSGNPAAPAAMQIPTSASTSIQTRSKAHRRRMRKLYKQETQQQQKLHIHQNKHTVENTHHPETIERHEIDIRETQGAKHAPEQAPQPAMQQGTLLPQTKKNPLQLRQLVEAFAAQQKTPLGTQMDAHEFLLFLLTTLEEESANGDKEQKSTHTYEHQHEQDDREGQWQEIGQKRKKFLTNSAHAFRKGSPIAELFSGRLRVDVSSRMKANTSNFQPFYSISVDIAAPEIGTITQALDAYMSSERVSGFKAAGMTGTVTLRHSIENPPRILVLHLKRFDVYALAVNDYVRKVTKHVAFGTMLILPARFISGFQAASATYSLVSVLVHHGAQVTSGHYTTFVRATHDEFFSAASSHRWWNADDDLVTPVQENEVLAARAYMLVYERI